MKSLNNNFLIWLSGADPDVLNNATVSEKRKYIKLGLTILIPAVMGWGGMWFAGPYLGLENNTRIFVATIWSLIVLTIDTYLVSSLIKIKNGSTRRYNVAAGFRILLAVFVGIVISHPIVLRILENNINEEIDKMRREENNKLALENRNTGITWNRENENNLNEINSLIECKEILLKAEGNGDKINSDCGGSSGDPNNGFRYRKLEAEISELKTQRSTLMGQIQTINNQFSNRTQQDTLRLNSVYSDDYLKRVKALQRLSIKDPELHERISHTTIMVWVLISFFIILDSIAVISKVITPAGEYEENFADRVRDITQANNTRNTLKTELLTNALENDKNFRKLIIEELRNHSDKYTPQQIWNVTNRMVTGFGQENKPITPVVEPKIKMLKVIIYLVVTTLIGCLLWHVLGITIFKSSKDDISIAITLYSSVSCAFLAFIFKT